MSYKNEVLTDSPVAYWRLGETSALSPAKDEADSHAGVYVGTPSVGVVGLLTNDIDKAMELTGDGSFVRIDDVTGLDQPTEFTLECLVKLSNESGGKSFISVTLLGASDKYLLFTDGGTDLFLQVVTADGAQNCSIPIGSLHQNIRYHVVATYDSVSGAANLYVNGVHVKNVTITGGVPLTGSQVWIGKASFGYSMNGVIDEAAVYSHVLTPARVGAHFAAAIADGVSSQTTHFLDNSAPFLSE